MAVYSPPSRIGEDVRWLWRPQWYYGESVRQRSIPGVIVAPYSSNWLWRNVFWVEFDDQCRAVSNRELVRP